MTNQNGFESNEEEAYYLELQKQKEEEQYYEEQYYEELTDE